MKQLLAFGLITALAFGCGDDSSEDMDSGITDSGVDAGSVDGGDTDSGTDDAGTEDAGTEDASTEDAATDGATEDAGSAACADPAPTSGADNLIIHQALVNPDGGIMVELYNPTDAAITDSNFFLCQFGATGGSYQPVGTIDVAAGGYVTIDLSGFGLDGTGASVELALYQDDEGTDSPTYSSANDIVDYMCFGGASTTMRKPVAEEAGIWSGDCAGSITGNGIRRIDETAGTSAADYEITGTYELCE